tara:strand:- start:266 stop:595 length:330 start_codon:yes stop_codon:yes gene_type:complete
MVKLLKIIPSKQKDKKYTAYFLLDNGKEKIVHFGASGYRDFILINDKSSKFYLPKLLDRTVVKDSYRRRHQKDLLTNDPTRAGYLSFFLLWNKKTLGGSIAHYKNKFKL